MITKIKKIITNNKKIFLTLGIFSLFALLGDVAFAAPEGVDKDIKEGLQDVVKWFNFGSQIMAVLLGLLTYLSTMFLSPEWTNGGFFGINTYLKSIWILVSNIVYFVFAFILIGIAFVNIVGMKSEKFQLKQALPKFIVGVLIVPFSWFIVQFVLSISSVLTIGALNLPYETFKGYSEKIGQVKIPQTCRLNLGFDDSTKNSGGGGKDAKSESWYICDPATKTFSDIMGSQKASGGIFGTLALYTYGVLGVENAATFNKIDIDTIKNMGDLVVKVLFDALFILIYAILMVALGLVLMVRGIYLWIYAMLSPVFGLMFFLDQKEGEDIFSKMNIKSFISLAMVPVYAMLALSFGMLFLFVVGDGMTTTKGEYNSDIKLDSKGDETSISIFPDGEGGAAAMKFIIKGSAANEENISEFSKMFGDGGKAALGVIGSLILKIFGIVVLWGAVMAALKQNKITEAVVKPLADFGNKVGSIAKASPGYLPVFGGQSMSSMNQAAGLYQADLQGIQSSKAGKFHNEHKIFPTSELGEEIRKSVLEGSKAQNPAQVAKSMDNTIRRMTKANQLTGEQMIKYLRSIEGNENTPDKLKTTIKESLKDNALTAGEIEKIYTEARKVGKSNGVEVAGSMTGEVKISQLAAQLNKKTDDSTESEVPAGSANPIININNINKNNINNKDKAEEALRFINNGKENQLEGIEGNRNALIERLKSELLPPNRGDEAEGIADSIIKYKNENTSDSE